MASSYSSSVTASQVGSYFAQQYYQVLQQQPEFVHQFYTDSSTMVRVDGESTETASAIFQIHTLIQSLHFSGIDIKTINSLESWSEGIVVVVSGSVRSKYFSGWRKFVQTFFLAPQEKGYFVMNDIFHFVSEEVINHLPAPLVTGHKDEFQPINSTSPELLVAEDPLETEARKNLNSLHIEGEDQADYYASQEHQHQQQQEDDYSEEYEEEHQVEEPSAHVHSQVDYVQEPLHQNSVDYVQEPLHQDTVEYVQEPYVQEPYVQEPYVQKPYVQEPIAAAPEPAPEPVKFTYASILQLKGKSVSSVPAQAPVVKSVAPAPEWQKPPEPVASFVPETTTHVAEEALANDDGESKSVYVRNLPTSVTSLEILQEFKNFGRIKQDGVFLKNRKDVGVCFAFVEFEDVASVQKAIEASPIQLAGKQIYIEERRANSSGSSRGGRGGRGGGRGRGSYNDSSRGRYAGGARGNGFRNV
ncbi:putative G3BP-like protein isoform X2 [Cynara cardunculus var. scolymus]|uniref:putative G3BP-like protein isoform X2 n=1 Tax=Cynara cardunculus var. scolymus TaxID=59895 RepID=UPI000D6250B1|nr:putative G3BP-like protein isoform X2 [Cynara cardunculus var. scolymus]